MLKLTGRKNGRVSYIAIRHIGMIEASPEGAAVMVQGVPGYFQAKETVEEIMAMPDMLYFQYPPMIVPKG